MLISGSKQWAHIVIWSSVPFLILRNTTTKKTSTMLPCFFSISRTVSDRSKANKIATLFLLWLKKIPQSSKQTSKLELGVVFFLDVHCTCIVVPLNAEENNGGGGAIVGLAHQSQWLNTMGVCPCLHVGELYEEEKEQKTQWWYLFLRISKVF